MLENVEWGFEVGVAIGIGPVRADAMIGKVGLAAS